MADPEVPQRRVVLHVGTMKSGTTTIQSLLFSQKDALADQGVLALGARWADQVDGVRELIAHPDAPGEPWRRLVAQARSWDGSSVISMEFLGPFIRRRVESAVTSFGDLPVHVVVTLRDLNRTIPSLWQETVQNGRAWTWSDYRAGARDSRPWQDAPPAGMTEPGRTFWRQQNAYRIVCRWADAVGIDQVCVVTVPPPAAHPRTLVERFGRAVGFSVDDLVVPRPENTALGAASAQLLQRVNARLAELGLSPSDGRQLRKGQLAKKILRARRDHEPGVGLAVEPWTVETSGQMVERLRAAGVRLVGDWSDLTPVPVHGVDPSETSEAELIAAAHHAFEGLRKLLDGEGAGGALPQWSDPGDSTAAIDALAALVTAGACGNGPA